MNWSDPKTGDVTKGFKEMGFMPEAFINMLALLGWNDGTDQEIFTLKELEEKFSVERISKAGAKFDFEKAKWYNHEWIKAQNADRLAASVKAELEKTGIAVNDDAFLNTVIDLIKDRCTLLPDFVAQSSYFFASPAEYDVNSVKPKWTAEKAEFFNAFAEGLTLTDAATAETAFKALAEEKGFKPGELMLPFRIMLVGGKFGPGVFDIALLLGVAETKARIAKAISVFNS
ncbi:Glutamate--tRNA ligase 1 [compost metagenome]